MIDATGLVAARGEGERVEVAVVKATSTSRLLAMFGTDTVIIEIVLPVLRSFGEGWVEGRITIAQEHFASNALRGRLLGLARGWGRGAGPLAVLASPSGEQHDLPLLLFGIALREAGWRIASWGALTRFGSGCELRRRARLRSG